MARLGNGPTTAWILLSALSSGAQPLQDIHPLTTECLAYGCYVNWYCAPSTDLCIQCPRAFLGTTEEDCRSAMVLLSSESANATLMEEAEDGGMIEDTIYYGNETKWQLDVDNCISECVKPQLGDECFEGTGCDPARFFCDFATREVANTDEEVITPPTEGGVCKACKEDIRDCLTDSSIESPFGVQDCVLCEVGVCIPLHFSVVTEELMGNETLILPSNALEGSPSMIREGPVVECSNLQYRDERTCIPGGNDLPEEQTRQTGKICLVDDSTRNSYFVSVVNKCAELGGVAVMMYQFNEWTEKDQTWRGSLSFLPTTIPSVSITYNDGKRLEEASRSSNVVVVRVDVSDVGQACNKRQFCNDDVPCVDPTQQHQYCDYKWGGGSGGDGFCRSCPVDEDGNDDPLRCFFTLGDDQGKITGEKAVESCAKTCAAGLEFPKCKFCPQDVSGFDFGLDKESDEKCRFCPENDVLYPEKNFTLFGEGVKCWHVQKFFDSVDVNADSRNCELAQMMNYVCGCSGSGYLGANTETKKVVLVWLPRVMAILSILGSTFIIYDVAKSPDRRRKVQNQLLIGLSIFDLMGSWAYAFTTLPIPKDHEFGPIYGAKGNDASCTAQGFFIQMGTVSAYMNVSLAVYYFMVIKLGWSERNVKKVQWALFVVPMAIGFAFAFAGISFYDSLNLWCNNTASYWPDIPVAIAIGVATILMGMLCWDVYQKEKGKRKWGSGADSSLSSKVFWQSFFYLLAFYLTWPPYLGLQYAWASGSSFTNYGLILTAATLVPLQGFWNMLVYIKPRYVPQMMASVRNLMGSRESTWSWFPGSSSSNKKSSTASASSPSASSPSASIGHLTVSSKHQLRKEESAEVKETAQDKTNNTSNTYNSYPEQTRGDEDAEEGKQEE